MKHTLGLVSVSFRGESPRDILQAMQQCGLTCIEWGSDIHCPPDRAAEIAALQKAFGIECCSYGTYFRLGVTPLRELPAYIRAAKTLGTDIVRVWCGDKDSEAYTEAQRDALFAICKEAAVIAEKEGCILCMECHSSTYTNQKDGALELMLAVNSPHFRMYWQPDQYKSAEENLAYAKLLSPYTVHLHVFHWKAGEKRLLREGKTEWKTYLSCFGAEKTLLLEFMPDGKLVSLNTEAAALKEIAK